MSYSNPVRQSLYSFEDCKKGKHKAPAAAEALGQICPDVHAEGIVMTIPMAGHYVSPGDEAERTRRDVEKLESLFDTHDVVFLLTDTRESRWLPTLLGASKQKLVLNAALGFDSYLALRHGPHLGCYFCNDVVAPLDSTRDRTLDQQCTVTRPGLAPVASATLVELLIGVLHHPERINAPAGDPSTFRRTADTPALSGFLPHQIRGNFSTYSSVVISSPAFPQCTACSKRVVDAYEARGFEMLLEAFNDPKCLERITGLDELQKAIDADDFDIEWDDDEEEEEDTIK